VLVLTRKHLQQVCCWTDIDNNGILRCTKTTQHQILPNNYSSFNIKLTFGILVDGCGDYGLRGGPAVRLSAPRSSPVPCVTKIALTLIVLSETSRACQISSLLALEDFGTIIREDNCHQILLITLLQSSVFSHLQAPLCSSI
jgi:hypothetical protein